MLTRITDRKIPCVYIHVYRITKNWGPGPYNSLRHADNRKYFSGLSLTRNRREALMFYLAREVGIFGHALAEKKVILMINEFKYGQTWKIWPSPLSLSLYSTFKNVIWIKMWRQLQIFYSSKILYTFWNFPFFVCSLSSFLYFQK